MTRLPLVSIGMPVYNGERYISEAIRSILYQTYDNFELIICDNCSNDSTVEICEKISQKDNRIRLYKNKQNIGAAGNYNLTFSLSKGKYFCWCAHDDIFHKDQIKKCVSELEKDSNIVLAYSKTMNIDKDGKIIAPDTTKINSEARDPSERFESLIKYGNKCNPIFGLHRKEILGETMLIESHAMGDKRLLAKLALKGPFKEINQYLFLRRNHSEQSATMVNNYRKWAVWFDPKLKGAHLFPSVSACIEFFKSVNSEKRLSSFEKRKCYKVLIKWLVEYRKTILYDIKKGVLNI